MNVFAQAEIDPETLLMMILVGGIILMGIVVAGVMFFFGSESNDSAISPSVSTKLPEYRWGGKGGNVGPHCPKCGIHSHVHRKGDQFECYKCFTVF